VREIRMLRAMRRGLEPELRNLLTGHKGGNPGYSQEASYGPPRQSSILPVIIPNKQTKLLFNRHISSAFSVGSQPKQQGEKGDYRHDGGE